MNLGDSIEYQKKMDIKVQERSPNSISYHFMMSLFQVPLVCLSFQSSIFSPIKFDFSWYQTFASIGRLSKYLSDISSQCFSMNKGLVFTELGAMLVCDL